MMTVLLILGKADVSILIDAVDGGGVVVLDKLYEYNKDDCGDVLIQLIKQIITWAIRPPKIVFPNFLFHLENFFLQIPR